MDSTMVNTKLSFIVCYTLEDVIQARLNWIKTTKFKLSFSQCVFQRNYHKKI